MLKINLFLKKYYFDTFLGEKHFEKQPYPYSQTRSMHYYTFKQ
jgi:hypothetical protein